jgi:hypothetical protein
MLFAIWPDTECEGRRPLQEMGERLEAQAGTEFLQPEQRKKRIRAVLSTLPKGNDIMRIFSYWQNFASILHNNCMGRI